MLKNYFKLAIKVLGRRKFFTFISLFGISFTLMVLILLTAFAETELGGEGPMQHQDRMVFMSRGKMQLLKQDTLVAVDSTLVNETWRYDTSYTYNESPSQTAQGRIGYRLIDQYLRDVQPVEAYTVLSTNHQFDLYIGNNKLTLLGIYADENYWRVFPFQALEGQVFNAAHVAGAEPVVVISERAARQAFGRSTGVVGESLTLGDRTVRVIGVIERPRLSQDFVAAAVYLPYTLLEAGTLTSESFLGNFNAVYLAPRPDQRTAVKNDIDDKVARVVLPRPEAYNRLSVATFTFIEDYVADIVDRDDADRSLLFVTLVLTMLLFFLILLPTLNLININVSRMLERRSEIGIRKAFGAHASTILYQFVFENVIITFIGGLIGLVLALVIMQLLNNSAILPDTVLRLNGRVFLLSLLICLIFGIVSGLLPAWRMSRIQIADAIKANQL